MSLPDLTESGTQSTSEYDVGQLTALTTPFTEEKANAIPILETPTVTQDPLTGVILIPIKITMQSYLNGGRSNITISKTPQVNVFEGPISVGVIEQTVGLTIHEFLVTFPAGTPGDWTLDIVGDNIAFSETITNPF